MCLRLFLKEKFIVEDLNQPLRHPLGTLCHYFLDLDWNVIDIIIRHISRDIYKYQYKYFECYQGKECKDMHYQNYLDSRYCV